MKFSQELPPKKGIAGKFKEVAMAALLAVGVGSGAENAPKKPAEKVEKPAAEFNMEKSGPKSQVKSPEGNLTNIEGDFIHSAVDKDYYAKNKTENSKVVKSGADTFKTDGNMSMEQLQEEMTGEAPEEFKSDYDIEQSKVVKSGADTYKSDGKMSMPPENK